MALLPARNILDGTALPVTSQMKTALGSLRDYCSDLLGTDSGNKAAARTTLGAAASGANTDITSITGNAATATTAAACSGNAATATTAAACSGNAATATKLSNDTGSAPSYSCRAWVNFNGTGVVAIRASGNVSSITDNGTGDYTVNFTSAMPDANYCVSVGTTPVVGGANTYAPYLNISAGLANIAPTTAAFRLSLRDTNNALHDPLYMNLSIFR